MFLIPFIVVSALTYFFDWNIVLYQSLCVSCLIYASIRAFIPSVHYNTYSIDRSIHESKIVSGEIKFWERMIYLVVQWFVGFYGFTNYILAVPIYFLLTYFMNR